MFLSAPEKELHVLWRQLLQGFTLILIESASDQIGFLLLKLDDSRLNRVLDGQSGNHTRALLANPMTTIRTLPFGCRVPPP